MSAGGPKLHNEDWKYNWHRGVPVLPGTNGRFRVILSEKLGLGSDFLGGQ